MSSIVESGATFSSSAAPMASQAGIDLAIVVPTFNEVLNIPELVARITRTLGPTGWEIIFVDDDSTDLTAAKAREMARADRRIRCLHRVGRRGLSSACIEGMLATPAPFIAVMDADLQHDEQRLPDMLALLRNSNVDLVVGSRYVAGGSVADWDAKRASMSRLATRLSHFVC